MAIRLMKKGMNIYLLERKDETFDEYRHDEAYAFVIVAKRAGSAREIAATNCGDEEKDVWLNPRISTLHKIGEGRGPERVVLRDYLNG